jgi:endonuclease/exonuclease/phosphatase (EEP) superfamily protein YafD
MQQEISDNTPWRGRQGCETNKDTTVTGIETVSLGKKPKSLLESMVKIAKNTLAVLFTFSILGYFGEYYSLFDLFSHFKHYYLILSLLLLPCILLSRTKTALIISIALLSANSYEVYPSFKKNDANKPYSKVIRILQANIEQNNVDFQRLFELIKNESPHIISLQEISLSQSNKLMKLAKDYPYFRMAPNDKETAIALFSKIRLMDMDIKRWGDDNFPLIHGKIKTESSAVTILSTHLLSPLTLSNPKRRNEQLEAIRRNVNGDDSVIFVGDLNITRWSPIYKKFVKSLNLGNSRDGFGILPTWPSHFFLPIIPIDHCLISKNIKVIHVKTGGKIGSDHYPLIVELGLP